MVRDIFFFSENELPLLCFFLKGTLKSSLFVMIYSSSLNFSVSVCESPVRIKWLFL